MPTSSTPIALTGNIIGPLRWVAGAPCLAIQLPEEGAAVEGPVAGHYFLVRCADEVDGVRVDWGIYLRRPLYAVQRRGREWLLHLPPDEDVGHTWLRNRAPGLPLNLLGPFGNGFALDEANRNYLLLADLIDNPGWLALLLGLLEPILDQGGRVTLLLRANAPLDEAALSHLPIAVEVQTASDESAWDQALATAVLWADHVCAGLPASRYAHLAQTIQAKRFRLEEGFCTMLVQADILCAVGACLACVIATANGGITRACTHGPVFDLTRLAL